MEAPFSHLFQEQLVEAWVLGQRKPRVEMPARLTATSDAHRHAVPKSRRSERHHLHHPVLLRRAAPPAVAVAGGEVQLTIRPADHLADPPERPVEVHLV